MLLIKNIKQLVQAEEKPKHMKRGQEMQELPVIENAFVTIENGSISDYGKMTDAPERADDEIDATDKFVLPAWCDSHTHLVFAATREEEFVDKIKGLGYEEIAAKGGGILNSARRLQNTSEEELYLTAEKRIHEIMSMGTGAVEIKSGYGLTVEAELKMLRVIRKLKENMQITIKSTFLGAHAYPADYKADHGGYLNLIINDMLPIIAGEGLADYIDVFCERNYFSRDEMDRILEAGAKYGLKPKVHVNQFSVQGGIPVAVKHGAVSVDHLEVMDDNDIEVLKNSNTICTALPSCSFYLNIPYAPVRKMLENNLPVALATDLNPGSTPSGNIPFVVSLACIKMKMLPEEAINAVTVNGAAAMELSNELGTITKGKKANLFITKPIPSLAHIPYYFGYHPVEKVILNGEITV